MVSKINSFTILGIEAAPVEVEVDVSPGLPAITIVGIPDAAVKESKERVRSAIKNSGFDFPGQRITVSLAPADLKKEGAAFDLSIALGMLAATGQINPVHLKEFVILGELALDGSIRSIKGALPVALYLKNYKARKLILPSGCACEAAIVEGVCVYPAKSLAQVVQFFSEPDVIPVFKKDAAMLFKCACEYDVDFQEVKGQLSAKRAMEVAVSGAHNVLMIGPPGSGKTMLAKRIPTIMPDMSLEEALETTRIHSALGIVPPQAGVIASRPFRAPHHTISDAGLIGGGPSPSPGEISLAHNGVLFLDELPEFHRDVLEALRQPLEDARVHITRAKGHLSFPSRFMLVAAMNPCPCGYFTDPKKACRCNPPKIQKYLSKISGPLLDRIDIHIEVPALGYKELSSDTPAESSAKIKKRVDRARDIQTKRFKQENIFSNGQMNHKQIKKYCVIDEPAKELLRMAMDELGFSARGYDKILKVSRTIADLAQSQDIKSEHISEAIQYRSLDRNVWT